MPSASPLKLFKSQHSSTSHLFTSQPFDKDDDNAPPQLNHDILVTTKLGSLNGTPCIEARRSCEFTHHSTACLRKATTNLNTLQKQLEKWCTSINAQRKVTFEDVQPEDANNRESFGNRLQDISSGKTLEIRGVVIPEEEDKQLGENDRSSICDIPVACLTKVEGAQALLQRLESDRLAMVQLLARECDRTSKLRESVDVSAYKRIHDLPLKVQEEHNRCIYDIHELKWHFEYQNRIETRLEEEVKQADGLNIRLMQEIDMIKENQPLLEEKLQLEEDAIALIQEKQEQADSALQSASDEMNHVYGEFEDLKVRCEEEQHKMASKVASLSNDLNANLDAFFNAQNENVRMKDDMVAIQNKIVEEENAKKSAEQQLENLLEIGVFLKEKVAKCKDDIVEQTSLCESLLLDIDKLQTEKGEETERLKEMRKRLENQLSHNTKELKKMIMLNKKTKKEIQTFKKRIGNCEKNRLSNEKAAKRAIIELETIQEDLQLIKEQALDLKHLYGTLQMKLDQEQLKAKEIEEKLVEQSAALQKENKEESHARKILLAKIKAETLSFEQKKHESELKKQKILKTNTDLQNVIENIDQQIQMLTAKYDERCKTIDGLNKLLEQVAHKSSSFFDTTSAELESLQAHEDELALKINDVTTMQQHMDTTTESLKKKSADMTSSSTMMDKFLASNQISIEDLQEEIKELQMQLNAANILDVKLCSSLSEIEGRANEQECKHAQLLNSRTAILDGIKTLLAESLRENDSLATQYINLQNRHINEKSRFINTFERNMIAEESLHDKQSLCELHTRLHEALKCYYQLRGIQTKAGLSRFEDMAQASNARLKAIEVELEKCTYNVTVFLKASKKSNQIREAVPHMVFTRRHHQPELAEQPPLSLVQ